MPQNNDLKKAHSFARKSLHLGISTDAAQGCFFKSRYVLFNYSYLDLVCWHLIDISIYAMSFQSLCVGHLIHEVC